MPELERLDDEQRAAAKALIEGPRKGVFGPFVPLLRTPKLLDRVAKLGECIRFESGLEDRVRELVTCAVARHVSNQFEWVMHYPLAIKAGVSECTLQAVEVGAIPRNLPQDEEVALAFTRELLSLHGVSDITYSATQELFGERKVVELSVLVGYFAMVSWLMNVARTPAQQGGVVRPLGAFPQ
jgi:4-carboxymuconolactone decarboxylase